MAVFSIWHDLMENCEDSGSCYYVISALAACRNTSNKHGRWLQHHYVPHTPAVYFEWHSLQPASHNQALIETS